MNFFIYREPGQSEPVGSMSRYLKRGMAGNSFVIAPFEHKSSEIYSIPHSEPLRSEDLDRLMENVWHTSSEPDKHVYPFPERSTTKEEHHDMIESTICRISSGLLEKCVISRAIVRSGKIKLCETFERLCDAYPDAFVFCFHTRQTGLWMGATPEVLLRKKACTLSTMALAGTMSADTDAEWDDKNIREHKVVADFIQKEFEDRNIAVIKEKTRTVVAGPVRHLQTEIRSEDFDKDPSMALELAVSLSPSPALSGMPRDIACRLIEETETYRRGYYGGFIGPIYDNGDFSFYVNLRSMQITEQGYCLYAGGGIMVDSDCEDEWKETERKAETLGRQIITANY